MGRELTNSDIDRQNILNNSYALEKIYQYIGFNGIMFDGEYKYTKSMVAGFYGVEERTIDRYLEKFQDELKHNGYTLTKGNKLKDLKLQFAHVINVGSKTTQLGLFNFRSFLNIGMLLTESENAKILRSKLLDIVIIGRGFSEPNIRNMRKYFFTYSDSQIQQKPSTKSPDFTL